MQQHCKMQTANCHSQFERRAISRASSPSSFHIGICCWQLAIACVLPWILLLTTAQAEDQLPTVRQVFVPVDNPKDWPKGERELVPFEEYLKLRDANPSRRPARRGTNIEWQSLSATFDPSRGVLTDGRWEAEVRGSEDQTKLLSLEPLDLPISELKWGDGDAVWGTSPSGETMLLVDAAERRLEGKFSRQGRRLQRTWQFDLRLATATVSEFKLRVPTKYSLTCSTATIRGPLTSGEEGWRQWHLNLGSQSRCELLFVESPAAAPRYRWSSTSRPRRTSCAKLKSKCNASSTPKSFTRQKRPWNSSSPTICRSTPSDSPEIHDCHGVNCRVRRGNSVRSSSRCRNHRLDVCERCICWVALRSSGIRH